MKRLGPFRPLEITWEDCLLGGGPAARFGDPSRPLEVEIGPGDDAFLLEQAEAEPGVNWLGIEYSRKRVRRYARKVEQRLGNPDNLRLLWRPALDVVGPFLSPAKVAAFHIYFPDPWPKAHHARYRLMAPDFAQVLARSLVPGGCIHMATDSADYASEILEVVAEVPGLTVDLPAPGYEIREAGPRITAFERRWRDEGREIRALRFRAVDG